MENVTTVLQKSDDFTAKKTMDVFRSLKYNIRDDRPTVWMTKDIGVCASTLRSLYCRYRKDGLIKDKLKIVAMENPDRVVIIKNTKK